MYVRIFGILTQLVWGLDHCLIIVTWNKLFHLFPLFPIGFKMDHTAFLHESAELLVFGYFCSFVASVPLLSYRWLEAGAEKKITGENRSCSPSVVLAASVLLLRTHTRPDPLHMHYSFWIAQPAALLTQPEVWSGWQCADSLEGMDGRRSFQNQEHAIVWKWMGKKIE